MGFSMIFAALAGIWAGLNDSIFTGVAVFFGLTSIAYGIHSVGDRIIKAIKEQPPLS